eukprot:SAG11_NODE_10445_length_831_cov_1.221311_1_plen_195_part_00
MPDLADVPSAVRSFVANKRRLHCAVVATLCACLCLMAALAVFEPGLLATVHGGGSGSGGVGASPTDPSELQVEVLRRVTAWLSVGVAVAELLVVLAPQPERMDLDYVDRDFALLRALHEWTTGGITVEEDSNYDPWAFYRALKQFILLTGDAASVVVLGFVVPAALAVGHPVGLLIALPVCVVFGTVYRSRHRI